ncbi:MAG: hypothetical protein AMS22_17460 [Thiotrichales bacterium SG8_50]|nr:MAG: hypothetical protein AMS22_17460 [Thiotrichales bacterium SG8_50]
MIVRDSVDLDVPPETVFAWFAELNKHYREWHPDHRDCYWLTGKGMTTGAVLYAEEILHGRLHKMRFLMTDVAPDHYARFRILGALGVLIPRGEFRVEPGPGGSVFTATLYPRCGRLLKLLMPARVRALVVHQNEEGLNLKQLLESGA